jgi:hypothetical protein
MRLFRNSVGFLAAVAVAALMTISACKSSDQNAPPAPGENRPASSLPQPQGNQPAAPGNPATR